MIYFIYCLIQATYAVIANLINDIKSIFRKKPKVKDLDDPTYDYMDA